MRKLLIIVIYSIYLFILIGFILHTSSNPEILGKYTYKYFLLLVLITLSFFPFIFFLYWIQKPSKLLLKGRRYKINLSTKIIIISIGIVIFVAIPFEMSLRQKYESFETDYYIYSKENFHPFLQLQLSNSDTNISINSEGFRSNEISKEKESNIYRIFVLGGSTVLNSGVSDDHVFSKLLQNSLNNQFTNKKIEVINAGTDGYTTQHSLIQYLFKIREFDPDLVIMWHGVNDLYYSCDQTYLSNGTYKEDYSHFLGPTADMVNSHFSPDPIVSVNLISFDVIKKFLLNNFYSDMTKYINKINRYSGIYANQEKYNFYDLNNIPSTNAYNRNLRLFSEILEKDNVTFILANQPYLYKNNMTREELNVVIFPSSNCYLGNTYPTIMSSKDGLDEFNKIAEKIAEEKNLFFIDLNSQIPKNLNYFTDDVHYTKLGNELIADILFKFISANEFVIK